MRCRRTASDCLISNETLLALHGRLLQLSGRTSRASDTLAEKYPAAQVAVEMDLKPGDTVRVAVSDAKQRRDSGATHDLLDVLGAAIRNHTIKNGNIAVLWAAAAEPGALRDALETARLHKLPVVFVVETEAPGEREGAASLLNNDVDPGEEMPHIAADGNDVVALYRVAHEAIDRARRDRGPTLIECAAFRVKGLRTRRHLDPVANLESYMKAKGFSVPGRK